MTQFQEILHYCFYNLVVFPRFFSIKRVICAVQTIHSSEDVWVTVSILPAGSREFEFPTKNIEVKNKPKDLQVTFETAQIEVRIKSDNKDLDDLNNDKDIKASIDLDGKKEGSYEVPVEIVLPDGYETVEDVTTEVVISSGTAVDDSKENKE